MPFEGSNERKSVISAESGMFVVPTVLVRAAPPPVTLDRWRVGMEAASVAVGAATKAARVAS